MNERERTSKTTLLFGTKDIGTNVDALADEGGPNSLWTVKLVCREVEKIDARCLDVNRDLSCRLTRVSVKENGPWLLMTERCNLLDRLDRSNLVVGVHDRHQNGGRPEGVLDVLNLYLSFLSMSIGRHPRCQFQFQFQSSVTVLAVQKKGSGCSRVLRGLL